MWHVEIHPIDFGSLCFHFCLSLGIFLFPLWFLQGPISCSVAYCLASTFVIFAVFSLPFLCSWFLVIYHYENIFDIISVFKIYWIFFVVKHVIYPRECSMFIWKVFSVAFTGICYKYLLSSYGITSFKAYHALLIFSLVDLSKDVIRVLKSSNVIALWSVSPIIL